ncbi:alpha/beta fold hydrolase [Curvibacter sp. APW13]|uniref:alpha/beta hydrolase family protein n=1 Tax=Curvibacter sp. APW13 TaxID=3077236 RepID=UPI0028DF8449|nr:alpha/beta hydrolase [Curvibacter sp. APW13]MDT8989849.1 alpha/beta fold hydrolase [Curvibacter sp. APW13]
MTTQASTVAERGHTLDTEGGGRIQLRHFAPVNPAHGTVVIGAAMGVPQAYYADFASWLSGQGWQVVTFDYRGSGASIPTTPHQGLRGFRANLFDWAHDYEAVVDWAAALEPGKPLYALGHSLGAQLPGMLRNGHKLHGLLGVAAGSGYWKQNAPQLRRRVPFMWYFLVPVTTRLFGYFPGKRLGAVGDLPNGVIRQWRKWCLHPHYSAGAEGGAVRQGYEQVRFPVLSLSIDDDEMMTEAGILSLMNLYANAPRRMLRVAPGDVGARRIGHLGAFRRDHVAGLWPRLEKHLRNLPQDVAV